MTTATPRRTTPAITDRLPRLSRRMTGVYLVGIAAVIITAFLLIQLALETTGLIDPGELQPLTVVVGAVVAIPVFALVTFIISCFGGALIALFDRRFTFRRLYLLTAAAVAAALLLTALGVCGVMLAYLSPVTAVIVTTCLNLLIAVCYGWLLTRMAGVARRAAVALTTVWCAYLLVVGVWGVLRG